MKSNYKPLTVLKLRQVEEKTGISRSQIYTLASKGLFPIPIKLGGIRGSGWVETEIDQWIEFRISERDKKTVIT